MFEVNIDRIRYFSTTFKALNSRKASSHEVFIGKSICPLFISISIVWKSLL